MGARVIQQVAQNPLDMPNLLLHLFPYFPNWARLGQVVADDLQHAGNASQRVADLMRQSRGQFAKRSQVLRTGHLGLVDSLKLLPAFPKLANHFVKVAPQVADLVVAVRKTGGHGKVAVA